MKIKTKFYLFVLIIGLSLVSYGLFFKDRNSLENSGADSNESFELEETVEHNLLPVNTLEGVLMFSDNLDKGNFKLVSGASGIYLKTARDFSTMVGLEVIISVSGTFEKFELIDIQPRVEKDGYIIPQ